MAGIDILALGEPLAEMVRLPEHREGRALYRSGIGGDALNAMVAASRQGASTGLISALGADPFGEMILEFCRHEGVDSSHVVVKPQDPTGVCFIHPDPKERRFFYTRRGSAASLYAPADLPESAIAAARVLHVTAISQAVSPSMRAAVQRAAEIARANGTLVSYDLNLRLGLWSLDEARSCIETFLPFADIILPSDDEAATLIGTEDPESVVAHFARCGARWVVLKRGASGVVVAGNGEQHAVPAPRVTAVDSAGAGDSFAGAFLAYLLESGDALKASRLAVRVAAGTVTGHGATDPIPRRKEILGTL